MRTLVIDVGGSNVKIMLGRRRWKVPTGKDFSARELVRNVRAILETVEADRISLGFPGIVRHGRPAHEPLNLGDGWMPLDYSGAFGMPVRIINDAAMQALGNYRHGRMLFVGLGTSVGASLVADDHLIPLQIGKLRLAGGGEYLEALSKKALKRHGKEKWSQDVQEAVDLLRDIFFPDDFVIGGGNSGEVEPFPPKCRRVANASAYHGGLRLWEDAEIYAEPLGTSWRLHRHHSGTGPPVS
jgi:polyphosphate glucokinase